MFPDDSQRLILTDRAASQIPNDGSASKRVVVDINSPSNSNLYLLKLVKAPRVRQGGNFSIFSSSVNEREEVCR